MRTRLLVLLWIIAVAGTYLLLGPTWSTSTSTSGIYETTTTDLHWGLSCYKVERYELISRRGYQEAPRTRVERQENYGFLVNSVLATVLLWAGVGSATLILMLVMRPPPATADSGNDDDIPTVLPVAEESERSRPGSGRRVIVALAAAGVVFLVGSAAGAFWWFTRLPANADAVDRALHDLRWSWTLFHKEEAMRGLKAIQPDERREEVSRVLERQLNHELPSMRQCAAEALVVWGTKENVPSLIRALDDDWPFVSRAAAEALARLKDELRALGPAVEMAVAERLRHEDASVRRAACKLLQDIGTQQSISALENATKDFFTEKEARAAIQAIKARP